MSQRDQVLARSTMAGADIGTAGYGPWASDLAPEERSARFRELHALALLLLGQDHQLLRQLRNAAIDPDAAVGAWRAMHALPGRLHRRLLCTYARLWDVPR